MSRGLGSLECEGGRDAESQILLTLAAWLEKDSAAVILALTNLDDPHRLAADAFLVRSLVAQYVQAQNHKGVSVPSNEAIDMYLRFWTLRPVAESMKRVLVRLTHHRNARRKFGQLFRKEWMLEMGKHAIAPTLSQDETTVRVCSETRQIICFSHSFAKLRSIPTVVGLPVVLAHHFGCRLLATYLSLHAPLSGNDLHEMGTLRDRRCFGWEDLRCHQHG